VDCSQTGVDGVLSLSAMQVRVVPATSVPESETTGREHDRTAFAFFRATVYLSATQQTGLLWRLYERYGGYISVGDSRG
jgi:hypothetical protein